MPETLWAEPKSTGEIPIFLKGIGISFDEIPIPSGEIHKSAREICISLAGLCISLADLCISLFRPPQWSLCHRIFFLKKTGS